MKIMHQVRQYGRKAYIAVTALTVSAFAGSALAVDPGPLDTVDVGGEITAGASRLSGDITIAIVILFALVAIAAAVMWGKKGLKGK